MYIRREKMEIIFIVISLFYAAVIVFLLITWYKDVARKEDTDKRILVLEKRDAEKVEKEQYDKDINGLYNMGQEQDIMIEGLNRRVEKLERKRLSKNS